MLSLCDRKKKVLFQFVKNLTPFLFLKIKKSDRETHRKPRVVCSVKLHNASLKRVGLPATHQDQKRCDVIEKRLLSTFMGGSREGCTLQYWKY